MEILQDSLAERIDKLIKKSSVVDSRLDIIEEELEEQTKISINGTVFNKLDAFSLLAPFLNQICYGQFTDKRPGESGKPSNSNIMHLSTLYDVSYQH